MSDEIVVISPKDIAEAKSLSVELAKSALMPQALRKKPEDLLAIVLAGSEMGLAPMQAVRGLYIINGKIGLYADLLGALVKRSPVCLYLQLVESSGTVATYKTHRKGDPEATTLTFTSAQAQTAGLTGGNWAKYPDAMLRARCLSAIARAVYPDLCFGIYDMESGELPPDEHDLTPQAAHVSGVRDALRAQIVDAEVVAPVEVIPFPSDRDTMYARIRTAESAEALAALMPEITGMSPADKTALRPVYASRKAEVGG